MILNQKPHRLHHQPHHGPCRALPQGNFSYGDMVGDLVAAVGEQQAAVLFVAGHVGFQLRGELLTLDDQHEFGVQIGAAQVEVVGTYGGQRTHAGQ